MSGTHTYRLAMGWTGDRGNGTSSYLGYDRAHVLSAPGKPDLPGSSDPAFRGDPARWNPEELLVASLSACHMLVYLHEAARSGVVVIGYTDEPVGEMQEDNDGSGRFRRVLLRPTVTVTEPSMEGTAGDLHTVAHRKCFIANSVNFPVEHQAVVVVDASVGEVIRPSRGARESHG